MIKRKRILVADRDENGGKLTSLQLQKIGIAEKNIVVVRDGSEAVEMAKKELFDIILLEIPLPGMDGIEASKAIREDHQGKRSKIICYSATYTDGMNTSAFDLVMFKPVTNFKEQFQGRILDVLNK